MHAEPSPDPTLVTNQLTDYRLGQLQLSYQSINAQMAALATQISVLQTSLPDRFLTRLEFAEILRQKEIQQVLIDKRLDANDDKQVRQDAALKALEDNMTARAWALALTLVAAVGGLIVGLVNVLGHPLR